MNAAGDFTTLDALRAAAGVKAEAWCREAGVLWLRYLQFKLQDQAPTPRELAALKQTLSKKIGSVA